VKLKSPLLEAVARERLLETLQAGEDLACSDSIDEDLLYSCKQKPKDRN
jgi:hypothetical protein